MTTYVPCPALAGAILTARGRGSLGRASIGLFPPVRLPDENAPR
jgi:hypothetical protein